MLADLRSSRAYTEASEMLHDRYPLCPLISASSISELSGGFDRVSAVPVKHTVGSKAAVGLHDRVCYKLMLDACCRQWRFSCSLCLCWRCKLVAFAMFDQQVKAMAYHGERWTESHHRRQLVRQHAVRVMVSLLTSEQ